MGYPKDNGPQKVIIHIQNGGFQPKKPDSIVDEEPEMPWACIILAAFTMFIVVAQFSIYFSSLWPFMHQIDPSASETFYGFTLAAFSFGQMIASPIFGYYNNKLKVTRPIVAIGIFFSIAGNLLYAFTEASPVNRKWIIVSGRLLGGLGAGITGTLRAYIATASTPKHKSRAISIGTMGLSLGVTAGPAVQACVTSIGYPGWTFGPVHINQYTAPAYICVIGALILLVLLMIMFKENTVGIDTRKDEDPFHYVPKYNKTAAFLCVLFWFSVCFSITNCESVEAPFTMAVFGWSDSDAVYYNSLIMTVSTIIGFGVYTSFAVWGQRLNERISITIGLCLMLGFYILTFTWPFYAERLQQLELPQGNVTTQSTDAGGGCYNEWCNYTPKLPVISYLVFYPTMSVGLPFSQVSISTLYAKVLGPRRQGFMQSLMTAVGSGARMLGPILISWLFDKYGPQVAWTMTATVMSVSIFAIMIYYYKLIPLNMRPKLRSGDKLLYDGGTLYRF